MKKPRIFERLRNRPVHMLAMTIIFCATAWGVVLQVHAEYRWASSGRELGVYECGFLTMGLRMLDGASPYPDPINESASAPMYPPLGSTFCATAWICGGRTATAPRLVISAALTAFAVLIALRVRHGGAPAVCAAVAVWLLMMRSEYVSHLHAVRPDALVVFFAALALFLAERWMDGRGRLWPVAVATVIAVYAKQHGVAAPLAVVATLAIRREWKQVGAFMLWTILPGLLVALTLHVWSDGWSTTTMLLGSKHAVIPERCRIYFRNLFGSIDGAALLVAAVFGIRRMRNNVWAWGWGFMTLLCMFAYCKVGGTDNSFGPSFLMGGAFFVIGFVSRYAPRGTSRPAPADRSGDGGVSRIPLFVLIAVCLVALFVWPSPGLLPRPLRSDREKLQTASEFIKSRTGSVCSVFVSSEPFLRAGVDPPDIFAITVEYEMGGIPAFQRFVADLEKGRYTHLIMPAPEHVEGLLQTVVNDDEDMTAAVYRPYVEGARRTLHTIRTHFNHIHTFGPGMQLWEYGKPSREPKDDPPRPRHGETMTREPVARIADSTSKHLSMPLCHSKRPGIWRRTMGIETALRYLCNRLEDRPKTTMIVSTNLQAGAIAAPMHDRRVRKGAGSVNENGGASFRRSDLRA